MPDQTSPPPATASIIAATYAIGQALDEQARRRDEGLNQQSQTACGHAVELVTGAGEACKAIARMHEIAHEWIKEYGGDADARDYIAKKFEEFDDSHRRVVAELREFDKYRADQIVDPTLRSALAELARNIDLATHETDRMYTPLIVRGLVQDDVIVDGRHDALVRLERAATELVDRLKVRQFGGTPKPMTSQPTEADVRALLGLPPWEVVLENMRKDFERRQFEQAANAEPNKAPDV